MLHLFKQRQDLAAIAPLLEGASCCVIVADKQAYYHHNALLQEIFGPLGSDLHVLLLSSNEEAKSLETAKKIWQRLCDIEADRNALLISFGGGTVCDVVGFAASCYMRGIAVMHFPTTLLAMVDAAIGGKTAVNWLNAKNVIGSYYDAEAVFLYPQMLRSLLREEMSNGIAEVIKAAVIGDGELFSFLEENMDALLSCEEEALRWVIEQAVRIKEAIVEEDKYESNKRRILNYGHTFGHAIEAVGNYRHSHGQAVAIGMCYAAIAGHKLGLADTAFIKRQELLCRLAGLPTALPCEYSNEEMLVAMGKDKKRLFNTFTLIVPEKVGKVIISEEVEEVFVREVLEEKRDWDRNSD